MYIHIVKVRGIRYMQVAHNYYVSGDYPRQQVISSLGRYVEDRYLRHQIESRFRVLKNKLKIRPIFLQSEERIKSLVLVNIMAPLVYSLIEWICQQNKLATSGRDALDIFRLPTIVTLTFQGQTMRQIGYVSSQAMLVMEVMKLGPPDPV